MAIYWMTEALPLAVTSLIPAVLFPLLGVLTSRKVAMQYLKDTNMLFLGGLVMAIAVEHRSLHRRIALKVMTLVGSKPRCHTPGRFEAKFQGQVPISLAKVTGRMINCQVAGLRDETTQSMWISNTAASAMMVPIVQALIKQLTAIRSEKPPTDQENETMEKMPLEHDLHVTEETDVDQIYNNHNEKLGEADNAENGGGDRDVQQQRYGDKHHQHHEKKPLTSHQDEDPEEGQAARSQEDAAFAKGMLLAISYGAAVGGTATLTGSPPNLVLSGLVETWYHGKAGLNFATWFGFAAPLSVVMLVILWLWLQFNFLGVRTLCGCCIKGRNSADAAVEKVIKDENSKMGRMTFAEWEILVCFICLVVLWFARDPKFMPGWGEAFVDEYGTMFPSDATAALTIGLIIFMLPAHAPPCLQGIFPLPGEEKSGVRRHSTESLLPWDSVQHKMPWGIILLLGGGFALAAGVEESGLSAWVSGGLSSLNVLPVWVAVWAVCLITGCMTEIVSNTATANIVLPLLAKLATSLNVSPLLLMMPATIVASFAFTLPVATPPNAIVFATGELHVVDMAKCGIVMDIVGQLLAMGLAMTYGVHVFGFGTYPDWAKDPSEMLTSTVAAINVTTEAIL
ncbi:PREDICTED: solute carrier family 13 member 5-like [Priapulus caudatus]|uniref:Solute carrier family 13 member 5-like n=1 Tax=Priapulus caudatus TaxID=37621 RepID=A0ABM1F1W2_PRICU|nr:PREDICTED: solute carrier family 13 member 5-like [Priapulus caudatus]